MQYIPVEEVGVGRKRGVCLVGFLSAFGDTVHFGQVAKQLRNNAQMRMMNSFF